MADGTPAPLMNFTARGEAGKYTSRAVEQMTKEGLEVFRFPSEVGSNAYPHYVMFFITERKGQAVDEQPAPKNFQIDVSSQNRVERKAGLGVASVLGTVAAGVGVQQATKQAVGPVARDLSKAFEVPNIGPGRAVNEVRRTAVDKAVTGGSIVAGVAGAGAAGAVITKEGASGEDVVTLKKCIALYMNDKPKVSYRANWQDTDLGALGGMAKAIGGLDTGVSMSGEGMQNLLQNTMNLLANTGGAAASVGLNKAQSTFGDFGDVAGTVSVTSGTAVNPFKAQLFKSMNFRTFDFQYTLLPKNDAESIQIDNIVNTFKKYMHPVIGTEEFFVGYPAEFALRFYYKGKKNPHLFDISSAALVDMKVEYGGNDFVTLKDSQGRPAEVTLSLSFLELELLDRKRVTEGGF